MRLLVENDVYHVHFRYGKYDGRRETRCELHADECVDAKSTSEICGAELKGVGFSWCSSQDEFVKAKGRKIALARAMQNLGGGYMPRHIRQAIWFRYLSTVKERVRV